MKMTVKHSYLIQLANILANPGRIFAGDCKGNVAYKVYLDRNVAKTYLDGFVQAYPVGPAWNEYMVKHDAVYAEANVQTIQQLNALPEEQRNEITAKIAAIDEEYKEVIEKNRALEEERRKTLEEEVEVDLYTLSPDDVNIQGQDSWEIWNVLYNDGNGIIRGGDIKPVEE